jgi:hypothetical protein
MKSPAAGHWLAVILGIAPAVCASTALHDELAAYSFLAI